MYRFGSHSTSGSLRPPSRGGGGFRNRLSGGGSYGDRQKHRKFVRSPSGSVLLELPFDRLQNLNVLLSVEGHDLYELWPKRAVGSGTHVAA